MTRAGVVQPHALRTPIHTRKCILESTQRATRINQLGFLPLSLRRLEGLRRPRESYTFVRTTDDGTGSVCWHQCAARLLRSNQHDGAGWSVRTTWQLQVMADTTLTSKPSNTADRESMNWLRCAQCTKRRRARGIASSPSQTCRRTLRVLHLLRYLISEICRSG